MNELLALFFQGGLWISAETFHLLVESLLTLVCGIVGFMVKRAVERGYKAWDELHAEVKAVRSELAEAKERIATIEGRDGTLLVSRDRT
jgi:uncharacterized membrane-anchored protein YhcB (DUF1043 family)